MWQSGLHDRAHARHPLRHADVLPAGHFDHRDKRIPGGSAQDDRRATGCRDYGGLSAQPKIGETFSSKVPFDVAGPMEYADPIFDKIEEIVKVNSQYISIARTPADLYEDKRNGRKSIMFGIENAIALNRELANVKHFAQRG